jgi:hypothetical protein
MATLGPVIPFDPAVISAFYKQNITAYKSSNRVAGSFGNPLSMDFSLGKARCLDLYGQLLKVFQKQDPDTVSVDYAHHISSLPIQDQHVAFVLRAELVYQLLIVTYLTLADQANHAKVYAGAFHPEVLFRADAALELKNYQLGIFGSSNPTSDIDIGVRYAGSGNLVALAHVVRVMEDAYVTHLGITSLHLDVETYGNTETVQVGGKEVFFINTAEFRPSDFTQVLPYAWASILRNVATAEKFDLGDCTESSCMKTLIDNIHKIEADPITRELVNALQDLDLQSDIALIHDKEVTTRAKLIVLKYIKLGYEPARQAYYGFITESETNLMTVVKPALERKEKLPVKMIVDALKLSALALVYRKESYTLAPTISHVVRILQGSAPGTIKDCPKDIPVCSLGKYGYLLSALEQIGYIRRVSITYCDPVNHKETYDPVKCAKKTKKYKDDRFDKAIEGLRASVEASRSYTVDLGGSRRKRRKRSRKTKRKRRRFR